MTNETPTDDLIRYDVMVQDALISVVRKVLQDAARRGLPGEHHFYISFHTQAPGVRLSTRLREKHPEEMTIVLQHQFWDLLVSEHGFEVGLSFGGVAERLLLPFDAMTGLFDPSVQFGLKFAGDETTADNDTPEEGEMSVKDKLEALSELETSTKKGRSPGKVEAPHAEPVAEIATLPVRASEPEAAPAPSPKKGRSKKDAKAEAEPAPASPAAGSAEVVSLDAFRKKK